MKTKVRTQFFIRKSVSMANGELPVYFRIRCNSQIVEVSTRRGIKLEDWDRLLRRINTDTEEAKILK